MRSIPDELLHAPFHRRHAQALGISSRMLEGARFVRIHPCVYRHSDHRMNFADQVRAAELALPPGARITGITRIQRLGLDFGPATPLRYVVQGELHLDLDGIFLHRTVLLPPCDDIEVTPAAAFLAYCARARTIDAIKVGDWLLHAGHASASEIRTLALAQEWRAGAAEALLVVEALDADSRSVRESEVRAILTYAGIAGAEVNRAVDLEGSAVALGDLWFPKWRTAVEYEGVQHQEDRRQYVADIDRYALYRRHGVGYALVTSEKLHHPRAMVREVHRAIEAGGYDGPPPDFGERWGQLFLPLRSVVRSTRRNSRRAVS